MIKHDRTAASANSNVNHTRIKTQVSWSKLFYLLVAQLAMIMKFKYSA